jgi:hypothetical protein
MLTGHNLKGKVNQGVKLMHTGFGPRGKATLSALLFQMIIFESSVADSFPHGGA